MFSSFPVETKSLEDQEIELLQQIKIVFIPDPVDSSSTSSHMDDDAEFTDEPTLRIAPTIRSSPNNRNKLIALMTAAAQVFGEKIIFDIKKGNSFVRTIYCNESYIDDTGSVEDINERVTQSELRKEIIHMNSSPKGNFFIRNPSLRNNCIAFLEAKRDIRLCNLSLLSLLFGISIKNGKSNQKEDLRGLFSQFSYSNIISVCRHFGINGIIVFDTVDLWAFGEDDEYSFPGNKFVADQECMIDVNNRIAVPIIDINKTESGELLTTPIGVLYPEIVVISSQGEQLSELLEVKFIFTINNFYKKKHRRTLNLIESLHFNFDFVPPFLVPPPEGSEYAISHEYINRNRIIRAVFGEQFYAFPYLLTPATNIQILRDFITTYTIILNKILYKGGNRKKTIKRNRKMYKSRSRRIMQNKHNKTRRHKIKNKSRRVKKLYRNV